MKQIIENLLLGREKFLEEFINDENTISNIANVANVFVNALENNNKILACGNGGSLCDSMHFAEELTGKFKDNRLALPAVSIADPAHITCVANDFGFEYIFSRGGEAYGKSGDVLLAISTSGNSKNVVLAAQKAKDIGMIVVALIGGDVNCRLKKYCDFYISTPPSSSSDKIQEVHIKCIHMLIELIEYKLLGK